MKRIIYVLIFGALVAAAFLLTPASSRANGPRDREIDRFKARDVSGRMLWMDRERLLRGGRPGTNSVPLNEGQVFLIIAGLGLGAKMLYDRRKNVEKSVL